MKSGKRRELDPTFKQLLTDFFAELSVTIETEVEVSRLPRTMDVLVIVESDEATAQLQNTPFNHFRIYNQIEFKGASDPLNIAQYALILGRTHLYVGESKFPFDEMSVTIVCANRPNNILKADLHFVPVERGIYRTTHYLEVTLIVINELEIVPINYPLLLFTSNEKQFRQYVTQLLDDDLQEYVNYAFHIRPDATQELVNMYTAPLEERRRAAQKFLRNISVEERLESLQPEEIVQRLNAKEIATMQQLLSERRIWLRLEAAATATQRIVIIKKMEDELRPIFLIEENRKRLLDNLDEQEQAIFNAWLAKLSTE